MDTTKLISESSIPPLILLQEKKLYLELLPNDISLYYIDINYKKDILFSLIQYLIPKKDLFLSLTINEKEISIICDSYIDQYFETQDIITKKNYKCIKIYDDCDNIQQIGIVKKISTILTNIKIPILYINSFNNNFIILENPHIEIAIQELQKNNFEIY
jgi:hypothetical protein